MGGSVWEVSRHYGLVCTPNNEFQTDNTYRNATAKFANFDFVEIINFLCPYFSKEKLLTKYTTIIIHVVILQLPYIKFHGNLFVLDIWTH